MFREFGLSDVDELRVDPLQQEAPHTDSTERTAAATVSEIGCIAPKSSEPSSRRFRRQVPNAQRLPPRGRSPPSSSRLASTPSTDSPGNSEKDVVVDGSETSGYSWGKTSERPGLSYQRSFDFDIEGRSSDGQEREIGQGQDSWSAATTTLQRQARTLRGKAVLGLAALTLVLLV